MSAINGERRRRDVVTIGASAGGVEALRALIGALPADYPGVLAAVVHRSPYFESALAAVLSRRTPHVVIEPEDGDPLAMERIYLAPRDRHMVFEDGRLRLHRGPKQHHTRPAVDPLFRSAAEIHGARVVGVLLSGSGDDGVDGLIAIKRCGGISITQDPAEAQSPWMPRNALCYDNVDLVLTAREIARALTALANGESMERGEPAAARVAALERDC